MSRTVSPIRRKHDLLVALVAIVTLFLCGAAWADPPGRVGRLADLNGTVWMYDGEQGEWVLAQRNRPLTTGDRLSTDNDARAELQVGSTTLRLAGATEIEVVQLDDRAVRVQVHGGSLATRVRSRDVAGEVEITSADGSFRPTSAGHYRIDVRDDSTYATVWAGNLRFESPDSALDVDAGQRAQFWQEQGTTHYTWSGVDHDNFSQWAQAEDRREERNASNRYVSPEMTGAEDLDRYGNWDRHPEYGALWYPHTVVSGWAPYRMGRWTWVSPWGWTWVDDAPWGFAPFHYGRWVNWRGRWAWAPGSYIARPVYAPALVAWIGGGNVSVGISVGSSRPPLVGWVPLAPRERWVPYYPASQVYVRNVNVTHVHVHPSRPQQPREPIMYTNRGVPGGVTMVSSDVLRERRPVTNAVVDSRDPVIARRIATERVVTDAAPAAPPRRVVSTAAVPPAPGRVIESRRERPPGMRQDVRRVGEPATPSRPSVATRTETGPMGQAPSQQQRYTPRGGERQADESAARRPREDGSVARPTPREPAAVRVAPSAETRPALPQRQPVERRDAVEPRQAVERRQPESRPQAGPAARPEIPQSRPAMPSRPQPSERAQGPNRAMPQQPSMPDAPVAPTVVRPAPAAPPAAMPSARPVAPPPQVREDDRGRGGPPDRGQGAGQGNGNNGRGGGPRQQER
jgi:hypothetical protein